MKDWAQKVRIWLIKKLMGEFLMVAKKGSVLGDEFWLIDTKRRVLIGKYRVYDRGFGEFRVIT